jgi:hypothetical protein
MAWIAVVCTVTFFAVWRAMVSIRREEQAAPKYLTTDDGGRTWRKVAVDVLALTNEEE